VTLAACATAPAPASLPSAPNRLLLSQLPGWDSENHAKALADMALGCRAQPAKAADCAAVLGAGPLEEDAAKRFFERSFVAEAVEGEGLLTGYFAPAYEARQAPDTEFSAPVRPPPPDPERAPDRASIEAQPATDALAWMRPEDLFFLQIQGSGRLTFPDGRREQARYAGANGAAFVAIAAPMVAEGLIASTEASADGIHAWLAAHRGPDAEAAMRLDPRYVFFHLAPDDGGEPAGAAGAPLIPGRSLAVDPAFHGYFQLFWIDADRPTFETAVPSYRRLAMALDTGNAIKGPVRADLYLGAGDAAGAEASKVHHVLRLYRIVLKGR
jgi:membrane-bound lytic murein transglycosylase A